MDDSSYAYIVIGKGLLGADEIGRLGALMMQHSEWRYDIAAAHFKTQFTD